MRQGKHKILQGVVLLIVLAAVILGLVCLNLWEKQELRVEETASTGDAPRPKKDLTTFLIMGLDKFEAPENAMGYLNDQQSDFLMLVVLDRR